MQTTKESFTVTETLKGKYGPQFKVGNEYYSYAKSYKGDTAVVGTSYTASIYKSEKGNKYVVGLGGSDAPVKVMPENQPADVPQPPSVDYRLEDKKRQSRISRAGIWQAVIQSPIMSTATDKATFLALAEELAESGLEFINRWTGE